MKSVAITCASRESMHTEFKRGFAHADALSRWRECLTFERKCVQLLRTRTHTEASVNKSELVDNIADGAGLSKADAERALNAFIESIQGAVASDDKVTLPGFGSFPSSSRAPPRSRSPRPGEPVQIAASKGVKFSAGAAFK